MPLWTRNLYACWLGCFITGAAAGLVMPFMPLYIEQLGVHETAAVERWSGLAFGATFMLASVAAPIWGRLADAYGRRPMLLRASLAMTVVMGLMGLARNVVDLVGLRLLMGAALGYSSSSTAMVATQAPKEQAGWALGTLATGSIAGSLVGPLLGGTLAEFIGIRPCFFVTSCLLLCTFLVTVLLVREDFVAQHRVPLAAREVWQRIERPAALLAVFATTFMVMLANLSVEPVVTVYVQQLAGATPHIATIAGLVFAASGLGTIVAAPLLGRLSDRVGPDTVLFGSLLTAAVLFVPQAYVRDPWQFIGLRFLLGVASGGVLPVLNTRIKHLVPGEVTGRVFGFNQSAMFVGGLIGPVTGGELAARLGIPAVFHVTCLLLLLTAGGVYLVGRPSRATAPAES